MAEDEKQPLAEWLAAQTGGGKPHVIPEGQASLPEADDMLEANTVFFRQSTGGKTVAKPMVFPSRSHAEIVFTLARLRLHGSLRLPEAESVARELNQLLCARLAAITEKANQLARSRTSDERKAADLAGLLQHWMIHGKPRREPQPPPA